jgi:hypothetical protein
MSGKRDRPRRRPPPLSVLVATAVFAVATAAASDDVQYTAIVERFYDGKLLVASAGSLVSPLQSRRR